MSDFVSHDTLPDFWADILQRHWKYLDTEEGCEKLEERKKLEGSLKDFLGVTPHERKFFLPITAHVLRKTVEELDDFTAYKAMLGFESISQYANNLFTKPWRKEYRVIKTYSGFYQHEVKCNLLDPESLFEAMGYRRVANETMQLEGPICPDQVSNVSRDAMVAYVECQIIKTIYAGLLKKGLSCTWQDVFRYRQKHVSGSSQAIKGIAYLIQERRYRKEQMISAASENCYANIQHVNNVPLPLSLPVATAAAALPPQCQNCAPYHQTNHRPCALYSCAAASANNNSCALHTNNNNAGTHYQQQHPQHHQPSATNLIYSGNSQMLPSYSADYQAHLQQQQHAYIAVGTQQQQHQHQQHMMSHSRSLEHYNEQPPQLPHRHSFDQQQQGCMATHHHHHQQLHGAYAQQPSHVPQHLYEEPFDCYDGQSMGGLSSASYAAVGSGDYSDAYADSYNVSGSRVPLPPQLSNQLNSHYALPVDTCGYHHQQQQQVQRSPLPAMRQHCGSSSSNAKDFQAHRQRSFPPDQQLIEFDDRAPLTAHDFYAQQYTRSQNNSFDYEPRAAADRHAAAKSSAPTAVAGSVSLLAAIDRLNIHAVNSATSCANSKEVLALSQQHIYDSCGEQQSSTDELEPSYGYVPPRSKGGDMSSSGGAAAGGGAATGGVGARGAQRLAKENLATIATTDRNSEKIQDFDNKSRILQHQELSERAIDRMVNGAATTTAITNGRRSYAAAAGAVAPPAVYEPPTERGGTSEDGYDDFVHVAKKERDMAVAAAAAAISGTAQRSPTQATKNQDGVGNFETWDYVYKNLNRCDYTRDLDERDDLLVQSLDLDNGSLAVAAVGATSSANSNGGADKQRGQHVAEAKMVSTRQQNGGGGGGSDKARTLEKSKSTGVTALSASLSSTAGETKRRTKYSTLAPEKPILKNGGTKIKSALKPTFKSYSQLPIEPSKSSTNNNNNNYTGSNNYYNVLDTGAAFGGAKRKTQKQPPPVATQVIVSSPNEWSCNFCTFLNPDTKRVCEMCAHSKDFKAETMAKTPTCV